MNLIQNTITILSGILAVSVLVVILLAEATTEEDVIIVAPAVSPVNPTGSDRPSHKNTVIQKTTKPYFPTLYQFFHPQTVKK